MVPYQNAQRRGCPFVVETRLQQIGGNNPRGFVQPAQQGPATGQRRMIQRL